MNPSIPPQPYLQIASDKYNRYPGELARLFLRLLVPDQTGITLQIAMPRALTVETTSLPPEIPSTLPSTIERDDDLILLLPLQDDFKPGEIYDIELGVRMNTFRFDQHILIETRLVDDNGAMIDTAAVRLTIFAKGSYLKYLPEIYESDDFTSRFLMLFESFWKPISQQIDQIDQYFDPDLTPPVLLPWLASWMGMPVDANLPLDRVRALLKSATMFFQCRGTLLALKTYLEIYTTGRVSIIGRQASNLVIGPGSSLGREIALGKNNRPNTASIILTIPTTELTRTQFSPEMYQRKIIEVVRGMVPAHVLYEVNCIFSDEQA